MSNPKHFPTRLLQISLTCFLNVVLFASCEIKRIENGNQTNAASPVPGATPLLPGMTSPSPGMTSLASSPTPLPSSSAEAMSSVTPLVSRSAEAMSGGDEPAERRTSPMIISADEVLMIPVVGIRREELRDTFNDARSDGRVHDAIDIMAPQGAPVVAAVSGKIIKFFDSERGGITIYQLSPDEKTVYYYAHLQRRDENIKEGDMVQQGTVLGTVGDTGNAGAGNFHLHFAIWKITDPKRFYDGENINPFPLLQIGKIKK